MPFKIVRHDITQMHTDAIVNTANEYVAVGTGCDYAVYMAAGYEELLKYREEKIGTVPEGDAFITPGFQLQAKYIIHAVSPLYKGGDQGEEEKLRSCYRKSLQIAKAHGLRSIAFPLISTGGFGYPKEEGMRIAVDEMHAFLLENEMDIFLVVFDSKATQLGEKLSPGLEAYIDQHYVRAARLYSNRTRFERRLLRKNEAEKPRKKLAITAPIMPMEDADCDSNECFDDKCIDADASFDFWDDEDAALELEKKLNERLAHRADTFSEYLLYLIKSKNMTNVEVYKRACLTKQYFHKINKNKDFHPEKIKALLLCVGAKLNLDETKDLLARAGYALSPADLTDIIFAFFIEHEHYDVIDIDIQLEEHGLPCIIS